MNVDITTILVGIILIQGFLIIWQWKKLKEKPVIIGRTSKPKRKQKKKKKNSGKPRGKPKGGNGGGRKTPDI